MIKQGEKNSPLTYFTKKFHPDTIFINESGLYSLVLSSKLPNAKEFKHWISSEVLPSIRKTGKYEIIRNNQRSQESDVEVIDDYNDK